MFARICDKRNKSYQGRLLAIGCGYGRDDVSPFVTFFECAKEDRQHGAGTRILLYRLNMEKGWVESWEQNATTRSIITAKYGTICQRKTIQSVFRPIVRFGSSNRCAEVRNHSGNQVFAYAVFPRVGV